MKYLTLSIALLLFASHTALAQPNKDKSLADTFDELLPKIGAGDSGAQQKWQDICLKLGAPGSEKQRAEACKLMCAKLDAKTPGAARLWFLTQLERIGREESVEPLAALLDDKDDVVREAAVRALANNPNSKVTEKLTAALGKAEGKAKIGLLNALGHRGDKAAVEAIAKVLAPADEETVIAAARALGRIPGSGSLKLLVASRDNAKAGKARTAISNALLAHADRMAKGRESAEAADIYKTLFNTLEKEEARSVRLAALRGVIQTSGDDAGRQILVLLGSDDPGYKAVAVGQIEYLSANALKSLAASLDKLPAPSRAAVVTAIAARGDRTQLPVALAAAKSNDPALKRAGLLALGRLGDASTVEFLLDEMSVKDAALAGLAAESLAALTAADVDKKLIAVLTKEESTARAVTLITVLERRKATTAVPTLLTATQRGGPAVQAAAFSALKVLASPEHVPGMIKGMLTTQKGKLREEAEVAVAAVCAQIAKSEDRAKPVLDAMEDKNVRASDLLPLLGRIGGKRALSAIKLSLDLPEPSEVRAAAFRGLLNWPDATANDLLLRAAEKEKEDADRRAALQALIRINCVLVDRTPEERLAVLNVMKKAMPLAERDDEKRALLGGIGFVRHIETLRFVVPYLDEPALAQAACRGVVELAHSKMVREPNKEEFAKALDRVIAICKDKGLVERAKQYKDGR